MWAAKGQILKVREIMHHNLKKTRPDTGLVEAARIMRDTEVGSLLVRQGNELVGIITDRDIVCRAVAEELELGATLIGEIMSKNVACCYDDQDVDDAAQIMGENKVRRLAVRDRDEHLVGIITLSDLASSSTERSGAVVRTLMRHH